MAVAVAAVEGLTSPPRARAKGEWEGSIGVTDKDMAAPPHWGLVQDARHVQEVRLELRRG